MLQKGKSGIRYPILSNLGNEDARLHTYTHSCTHSNTAPAPDRSVAMYAVSARMIEREPRPG